MVLSLDTTVAGVNANSYGTLAEADDYFLADVQFNPIWTAFTEAIKIQRIVSAARAIDRYPLISTKLRGPYYGVDEQAREFPRLNDVDTTIIHCKIKYAQFEMIKAQYLDQDTTTGQSGSAKQVKSIGVYQTVDLEFGLSKTIDTELLEQAAGGSLAAVEALLRPWLSDDARHGGTFEFVR